MSKCTGQSARVKETHMDHTTLDSDTLFSQACNAMAWGQLGAALTAADELCRPERARTMVDVLPCPYEVPTLAGYTREQLAPLADRVAQFNSYVESHLDGLADVQAEVNDARWGRGNWG
jgi:hypothetical protein